MMDGCVCRASWSELWNEVDGWGAELGFWRQVYSYGAKNALLQIGEKTRMDEKQEKDNCGS